MSEKLQKPLKALQLFRIERSIKVLSSVYLLVIAISSSSVILEFKANDGSFMKTM